QTVPEAEGYFVVAGNPTVSQGISFTRLARWEQRDRKQQEIVAELAPKMAELPGVLAFPTNPPSLGQNASSKPVWIAIQSSADYAEINKMVEAVLAAAEREPSLANVETRLKLNKPELKIS